MQKLREHERIRIIIETKTDLALQNEINEWETASNEDLLKFENDLERSNLSKVQPA